MKIVGITACTAGIAHTYLAKEKLLKAGKELGYDIKIETQGTIGIENELTPESIKEADAVLIAADINVSGKERFSGKRVLEVPVSIAVKSPKALLKKMADKL